MLLFLLVQDVDISANNLGWSLLQKKVQERRAVQAFKLLRYVGIEPILIKGLAAAAYYPEAEARLSVDMDLAVSESDFDAAQKIVTSPAAEGMAIDLHRGLRHLDTLAWDDLFANSVEVGSEQGSYRVLRIEDHLRVLCTHWLNDGGIHRSRLWDIYYLIEKHRNELDWARILGNIPEHRRRWIVCTIGLASRYLELSLHDTPIEHEAKKLPAWLTDAVETEWDHPTEVIPLWLLVREPARFLRQVKQRFDPNPIRATVEMEGSFDSPSRIHYKLGNFFQRLLPSFGRNIGAAVQRDRS